MYIVQYLKDGPLSDYLCWSYPVDYFQNQVCLSICPSVCLSVYLSVYLCVPFLDYCWCYPVDYCIQFQVSSIYIYLTVPFSLNIYICLSICVYLFWTTAGVILLIISRSRFVSRAGDITCLHFAPLKIKKY